MHEPNALDRFYEALARGDVDDARACFTADARVWHCFDGVAQTVDAAAVGWAGLIAVSTLRTTGDVYQTAIDGGVLRQHVMVIDMKNGDRKAWAVCLIVRIEGDRMTRLEEYIDRAGSFVPTEPISTPGF